MERQIIIDETQTVVSVQGFARYRLIYIIFIIIIFAVGLGIRFYDLSDAPLDFHPTRQLYSALKARGMYYQNLETAPEWQRELAVQQWKIQGLIEPPVMERISSFFYTVTGGEDLRIPRILSIVFWFLGGIALVFLTKELTDENGAVFSLVLYMVTPYTAIASRSFQPDPLMVGLMLFALWGLVRWNRSEKWTDAIMAGLFSGLAIFIKSVSVFPIAAALIIVVVFKKGFLKSLINKQVWVMALLAIVPYLAYHIYGVYINGELQSQFSLRFFPQLWFDPAFWLQWNGMISKVVGFEIFLVSILGVFLLRKKIDRAMIIALFTGYFIYGMVLSYHISTHDYYQLPLVPIVVIGAGSAFSALVKLFQRNPRFIMVILLFTLSYFVAIKAWDVRVDLKRTNYKNEVQFWTTMGDVFSQNDSVIGITQDYGYRFEYWGWHKIENWMSSSDFALRELAGQEFDMQSWFKEEIAGKDYFLVTQFSELDRQPQIKKLLQENYSVWQETGDYIIFNLKEPVNE